MWSDVLLNWEPVQASSSVRRAGKPAGRVTTSALAVACKDKLGLARTEAAAARTGPWAMVDILMVCFLLAN